MRRSVSSFVIATAVALSIVLIGAMQPAQALTKRAGCPTDVFGPVDAKGKLSAPTTWRLHKTKTKWCLSLTTAAEGKKPLRVVETKISHDGLCNATRTVRSRNTFGYKLAVSSGYAPYVYARISDGTKARTITVNYPQPQVC